MADASVLLRAYLIVGTDGVKRRTALAHLRRYVPEEVAAFNVDELEATSDMEPGALVASLSQMALASPVRVVVVRSADKLPRAASEAVVAYLGHPNPTCTLALVADSLSRSTRLYKAVAAQGPKAVIDCSPKKRWELPALVCRMGRHVGVAITEDGAQELVARVGESTPALENALRTLGSLLPGRTIGRPEVEANVAQVAEVRPWDLLDALSARDGRRSVRLLRLILGQGGSALGILALVEGRLRELLCARSMVGRGTPGKLAEALGKRDWQVRNHVRWAQGFRAGELEGLLRRCVRCERALKGEGDGEGELLALVLSMCGDA